MATSHANTEAVDSESDEELQNADICRVCRCEGTPDHPLFFPCVCTGSIKYIHQDCLVEWLKYSKKEYCELCKHKFRFTPIYAENMPSRLPISVLLSGLLNSLWKGFKTWLHYTIVALSWLIVVPVFACRVHRCLFHRSVQPLISLPSDLASLESLPNDLLQGGFLVTFTLCAFIALVWLREQIGQAAPAPEPVVLPQAQAQPEVHRGVQAGPGLLQEPPQEPMEDTDADWEQAASDSDDDSDWLPPDDPGVAVNDPELAGPAQAPAEPNQPPAQVRPRAFAARNANVNVNVNANVNEQEDAQRNQQELERAAEELTWERLLGLDGSWVFLEHVLWVIALNTVCVIIFVFVPYHLGRHLLDSFELFDGQTASTSANSTFTVAQNTSAQVLTTQQEYNQASLAYQSTYGAYVNATDLYMRLFASQIANSSDTQLHDTMVTHLSNLAKNLSHLESRLSASEGTQIALEQLTSLTSNLSLLVSALNNLTVWAASATDSPVLASEEQLHLMTSQLTGFADQLSSHTTDWLGNSTLELQLANSKVNESESESDSANKTASVVTEQQTQSSWNEEESSVVFARQFERLGYLGAALITLVGYLAIGCALRFVYNLMTITRAGQWRMRLAQLLLMAYTVVKVALLVTLEIGIFPLCVGWWIDICTLPLFGSSWSDRVALFGAAPGTVCFLHWIVGMIYVFYFASFVILLREVLRPGVLWFLRNLNDPEFNPIQEMIVQPTRRHVRRFVSSCVLFGTSVIFVLYAPVRLVRLAMPSFLPFNVHHSDAPVNEISYSFLVLNLILPVLLEHVQLRAALKTCVRRWCVSVGWALDLRSYLLGEQLSAEPTAEAHPEDAARPQVRENLAARHRAMLMDADAAERVEANAEAEGAYTRPNAFAVRIAALVGTMWLSLSILGTLLLTVPVATGRALIAAWLSQVNGMKLVTVGDELADSDVDENDLRLGSSLSTSNFSYNSSLSSNWSDLTQVESNVNVSVGVNASLVDLHTVSHGELLPVYVHELYTTALGFYMWWIVIRLCSLAEEWYKKNATEIVRSVKTGCVVAAKASIVCTLMLVVLPILIGLLFDLVVIIPLRVATNQTPIYNILNHWTFGILHMKILAALTAIGPQWWLRDELELLYANGLRNIRLAHTLGHLCYPLIASLGIALSVPYVLARSVFPLLSTDLPTQHYVLRNVYPALVACTTLFVFVYVHFRQLRKLYEHIRNENYLIGQRLVNYDQCSR